METQNKKINAELVNNILRWFAFPVLLFISIQYGKDTLAKLERIEQTQNEILVQFEGNKKETDGKINLVQASINEHEKRLDFHENVILKDNTRFVNK